MKKKIAACCALAVLTASLSVLAACKTDTQTPQTFSRIYYTMGTSANLVVSPKSVSEEQFEELSERVGAFLEAAESSLSLGKEQSCIYKFNRAAAGEKVEIDATAYTVLSEAVTVYTLTEGYYNPAVWHSANAYRFAVCTMQDFNEFPYKEGEFKLPEEKYVLAFQELSQAFAQLQLSQSDGKYYAVKPETTVQVDGDETEYNLRIDLGGIGKGWCVDKVNEMLEEANVEYGYFSFGTSSMDIKKYAGNDSGDYNVSSRDPRGEYGAYYVNISVQNSMLSTSGDHEQYYEIDGVRYCHIINPFTGSPIQTGIASVTIIGGSAVEDDALTTALSAMGKDKAVEFINEKLSDRTVVMLVFEGGEGKIITNRPQDITIINAQYRIANGVENGRIVLNDVS